MPPERCSTLSFRGIERRAIFKNDTAGRRPELTGGGLIRSAGGWRAIRAAYQAGIRLTSDERILGSSSFVEKTLASAGEDYDRRMRLKASGIDLDVVMDVVSASLRIVAHELSSMLRMFTQLGGLLPKTANPRRVESQ